MKTVGVQKAILGSYFVYLQRILLRIHPLKAEAAQDNAAHYGNNVFANVGHVSLRLFRKRFLIPQ